MKLGGVRKLKHGYQAVWAGGGKGCTKYFSTRKDAKEWALDESVLRLQTEYRKRTRLPAGVYFDRKRRHWSARPPRWAPRGLRIRLWSESVHGWKAKFFALAYAEKWLEAPTKELNYA